MNLAQRHAHGIGVAVAVGERVGRVPPSNDRIVGEWLIRSRNRVLTVQHAFVRLLGEGIRHRYDYGGDKVN